VVVTVALPEDGDSARKGNTTAAAVTGAVERGGAAIMNGRAVDVVVAVVIDGRWRQVASSARWGGLYCSC